jgi:hypothetical protein
MGKSDETKGLSNSPVGHYDLKNSKGPFRRKNAWHSCIASQFSGRTS